MSPLLNPCVKLTSGYMLKPLKPPPESWNPYSVVGVRERLKISGFGIKNPLNLQDQITDHKWRYAAGDTGDMTEKQAANAHKHARGRVWDLEMAKRANAIDKDDRTDAQTAAIQKVEHPKAYEKSRKGQSRRPPMIPPPATWRPELVGEERTEAWIYALPWRVTEGDHARKT